MIQFDGWLTLANAVIKQGVDDYLEAKQYCETVTRKKEKAEQAVRRIYKKYLVEIPSFLQSDYYRGLTDMDGNTLLKKANEKYIMDILDSAEKIVNFCRTRTHCSICMFYNPYTDRCELNNDVDGLNDFIQAKKKKVKFYAESEPNVSKR